MRRQNARFVSSFAGSYSVTLCCFLLVSCSPSPGAVERDSRVAEVSASPESRVGGRGGQAADLLRPDLPGLDVLTALDADCPLACAKEVVSDLPHHDSAAADLVAPGDVADVMASVDVPDLASGEVLQATDTVDSTTNSDAADAEFDSGDPCGDAVCDPSTENCENCPVDCGCADSEVCFVGACCLPDNCSTLGAECGTHPDGCGSAIDCLECPLPNDACVAGTCLCSPDCKAVECGSDGCGGQCGECGEDEQCSGGLCWPKPNGEPTLTVLSPTYLETFASSNGQVDITMEFVVENWLDWPSEDTFASCFVNSWYAGKTTTGSFVFSGVTPGPRRLTCRLADLNGPLANCEATGSVVVRVSKPCQEHVDCPTPSCYVGGCGPEGQCVVVPDFAFPCCCISDFDCDCSAGPGKCVPGLFMDSCQDCDGG